MRAYIEMLKAQIDESTWDFFLKTHSYIQTIMQKKEL